MIDTGAAVSVLSSEIFSANKRAVKSELLPSDCRLTTASGQGLETHGTIKTPLQIGKTTVQQDFVVAGLGNCEGILGLDFLENNCCLMNFSSGVLEIQGKSVSLAREVSRLCARLKAESPAVIPPRSEMFVWARLNQDEDVEEAEGLVEGVGEFGQGRKITIPRCLLTVKENRVLVPITNFSEEEKQVDAGADLARIESATSLSSISLEHSEEQDDSSTELPEHLEEMVRRASPNIKAETRRGLRRIIKELQVCFACPGGKLGRCGLCKHKINVQGNHPCKSGPRRYPLAQRDIMEEELQKMLNNDIIEPSSSPWAANVVLVRKKDNSVRFCVDYRRLNAVTKKDAYPLPHIGDTLDALSGSRWFSCLDMSAGFNQVEMEEGSKEYTAFNTHKGLFQYKVLPFGLCNSPPTFQRLMELVLGGLLFERCLVYIDDVVVIGKTEEEALENLRVVLLKFKEANLKLKPSKCFLFQEECTFLGHTVNADGTTCERKKVEAVQNWPEPRNVKEVRSFLGTCSYYRKYIPHFADVAAPLTNLTRKSEKFIWSPKCQEAFENLKMLLTTAPILAYPNNEGPFILDTDASGIAIGGVLSQIQEGEERVLSYASMALSRSRQNYCATYRELYAVVKFVKYYSHYLWGRHFLVRTDHSSLKWLQNFKNPEGVVARWLATLGTYDFDIEHRRGTLHGNADGLSRIPRKRCMREECGECIPELPVCSVCQEGSRTSAADQDATPDSDPTSQDEETTPRKDDMTMAHPGQGSSHKENQKEEETTQETLETHPRERDLPHESVGPTTDRRDNATSGTSQAEPEPSAPDWLDCWKNADLVEAQSKDPLTKPVIAALKEGTKPESEELALYSSSIRTLFRRWDDLEMIDEILYIKITDPVTGAAVPRLVAPEGVRTRILKMLHDERPAGHMGRERTISRVTQHVYWPGMAEDVRSWVRSCEMCARRKPGPGRAKCPMGHKNVGIPFERIAIDIMSLPTESHDGYRHIMVVECYYSKWVEAYCLTDHTAQAVGDKLLTQWICRFGVPSAIHTDQGAEFEGNLFRHLCKELGSLKTRTLPYHPQGDGMVERQNRTIQAMLSCYVNDCHDDWSDHLDYLMMACRSSRHESTGCSPNRVIFGREVNLPLTVQLGEQHFCQGSECPIQYVNWVKNTLEKVYSFVRTKSKASTARQKAHHDKKSKIREIAKGMLVWRWYPPKGKPKLGLGWTGPYLVQELIGKHTARLKSRDREVTVHVDDLKPYEGREYFFETEDDEDSDAESEEESEAEEVTPGESYSASEEDSSGEDDKETGKRTHRTRRGREVRLPARFRE